jgi:hypothetical protein
MCHGKKKILSSDRMMELLLNEHSEDDLIPESNSNKLRPHLKHHQAPAHHLQQMQA